MLRVGPEVQATGLIEVVHGLNQADDGSPAALAGIRVGDMLAFTGDSPELKNFPKLGDAASPGPSIEVRIMRGTVIGTGHDQTSKSNLDIDEVL